ncbi:stable inheritance protein KleA [Xanthomonas euvesicatoria]|uniref:stable inheritance protein KleA n=1 Tax=Xanthomonas euvesicatoria TaxID=456327 RepID=UPI001C4662E0|nr:stable inheritance protein KleA [Xanthomonas euvesicatoria]MBV6831310.1 stable inheritance protein KleA [Xanthomonas campestris pv. viegasii]
MSNTKIMPWIDELEGAAATNFPARRDEIAALLTEAAELVRKAEELRGKAYFAGCSLEGEAKGHWSMAAVEQAKRRVGW